MNISEQIYKLRTDRNLSQEELSHLLDVSRQSVSKWETGASVPDLDKLMKLCDVFEVTLDELTGRVNDSPVKDTQEHTPAPETTSAVFPQVTEEKPEPTVEPVSVSVSSARSGGIQLHHIIGLVILSFSLLGIILISIFINYIMAGLLFVPGIICGIACLTVKNFTPWTTFAFISGAIAGIFGAFCYLSGFLIGYLPMLYTFLLAGCIVGFAARKKPVFALVWSIIGLLEFWSVVQIHIVDSAVFSFLHKLYLFLRTGAIYTDFHGFTDLPVIRLGGIVLILLYLLIIAELTFFAKKCFQKKNDAPGKSTKVLVVLLWIGTLFFSFCTTYYYISCIIYYCTVASSFFFGILVTLKCIFLANATKLTAQLIQNRRANR